MSSKKITLLQILYLSIPLFRASNFCMECCEFKSKRPHLMAESVDWQQFGKGQLMLSHTPFAGCILFVVFRLNCHVCDCSRYYKSQPKDLRLNTWYMGYPLCFIPIRASKYVTNGFGNCLAKKIITHKLDKIEFIYTHVWFSFF